MKTMTVFEARNHFTKTLEAARDDVVIVTRNGKPVAAIRAIDDDDLEDLLLERSERFWEMIARARRGKSVAIETLRKELTRAPAAREAPRAGGAAGQPRPRRRRAGPRGFRAGPRRAREPKTEAEIPFSGRATASATGCTSRSCGAVRPSDKPLVGLHGRSRRPPSRRWPDWRQTIGLIQTRS